MNIVHLDKHQEEFIYDHLPKKFIWTFECSFICKIQMNIWTMIYMKYSYDHLNNHFYEQSYKHLNDYLYETFIWTFEWMLIQNFRLSWCFIWTFFWKFWSHWYKHWYEYWYDHWYEQWNEHLYEQLCENFKELDTNVYEYSN